MGIHSASIRRLLTVGACLAMTTTAGTSLRAEDEKPAERFNAASAEMGARIEFSCEAKAQRNGQTPPEHSFDGNPHSRCVVSGGTYTFSVEFIEKVRIESLSFAHSDYAQEEAPKDLLIELDDGSKIEHTLEQKPSTKGKIAWQTIPLDKEVASLKITVKSVYESGVKWGGMGEIAAWTTTNLKTKMAIPDYDAKAKTFVHAAPPAAPKAQEVHQPPQAKPGEHPCLLLTPAELEELKQAVTGSERAKEAFNLAIGKAKAAVEMKIEFPDPKGPQAQVKDRGDAPAKAHDQLALNCGSLAVAYALTGEKPFAEKAKEILLGYAERYEQYPVHKGVNHNDSSKVMAQRLSEAMWLIPQIIAYDYIFDTLTEDERKAIETGLIRPCLAMIHLKNPNQIAAELDKSKPDWRTATPPRPEKPTVVGNWTNFYNLATLMAGASLGDKDLVDLAVFDTKKNIQAGIGEDGMWGEGAIGYQMFALQALTAIMEVAARQGQDLWGFADARIKMPFDAVFRYAYPDGTCAGINDSGRAPLGGWTSMVYDYAWLRYQDPAYAVVVNNAPRQLTISPSVYYPTRVYEKLPEAETKGYGPMVFGNLGYGILRNDQAFALMDYGPHGGPHGHYDKLNLLLFAAGDEMGGEPKMHRYEDPLHGQWTTQTVAHNTMTVDQRSQKGSTGKLVGFENMGGIQVMRAECDDAYNGVLLDRTVAVVDGLVIDLYHGRSAREHTWDRTFRFQGEIESLADDYAAEAKRAPLGDSDGYQHLHVVKQQPAEDFSQLAWKLKDAKWVVSLAGAKGQEMIACKGPDEDRVVLMRQKGNRADFAAVYQVDTWGGPVTKVAFVDTQTPDVSMLRVERGEKITEVLLSHKPGAWKAVPEKVKVTSTYDLQAYPDGWKTIYAYEGDVRVLVAQYEGDKPKSALWLGGQRLTHGEDMEFFTDKPSNGLAESDGVNIMAKTVWMPDEAAAK